MPNRSAERSTPMLSIYDGRQCSASCSHADAADTKPSMPASDRSGCSRRGMRPSASASKRKGTNKHECKK